MPDYRSLYYESRGKSYLLISKDGDVIVHNKIKASSLDDAIEQARREPFFVPVEHWQVRGDNYVLKQSRKVKS